MAPLGRRANDSGPTVGLSRVSWRVQCRDILFIDTVLNLLCIWFVFF